MRELLANELVKELGLGWNLGNTMDAVDDRINKASAPEAWETAWGNPVTTRQLITKIREEGFHVIRYPVSWRNHIGEAPEYNIDRNWMNRVQELVDWAYDQGAYVILNIHHEGWHDPYYENLKPATEKLCKVWQQIAGHFAGYDEHLIFEGMNEPRKCGTQWEWNGGDKEGWDVVNALNEAFVKTIRASGGNNKKRCLMVPGYAANCTVGIRNLKVPEDDRVIVSVHSYEPYEFALKPDGRGLWNHDTKAIDGLMEDCRKLFLEKGIPVIIGEFGAAHRPDLGNEASRAEWADYFVSRAAEQGIPCIWWDNGHFAGDGEPLGLMDRNTLEWKYPELAEALKRGMKYYKNV